MLIKNQFCRSAFLALASGVIACAASANAAQIFVDDDHGQCPNAQYTSIQTAVTAASPGDTVNVCSGTYPEQVVINKKLTVQGYETTNRNQAIVMPIGAVANSTSLSTGAPIAAIVFVDGIDKVDLSNLTIDGSGATFSGCGPTYIGVYYRNASGTADSLAVRNMSQGPGLVGCQSGLGIFVQSGLGGKSKVTLSNNSVHHYDKNGITANGVGTNAIIKGNNVAGVGATPDVAQNGIQIGRGATGSVEGNFVIDHIYSLCSAPDAPACANGSSTNVLIFECDGVKVMKNTLGNSQDGIYYLGNKGEVSQNTVFQTLVFNGIDLIGDLNKATGNSIFNSAGDAIYMQGNKNEANNNIINEAPTGVLIDSPSTNPQVAGNKFFNTAEEVVTAPVPPIPTMLNTKLLSSSATKPAPAQP
jgi:nitrous oxidase accessory protein NosD